MNIVEKAKARLVCVINNEYILAARKVRQFMHLINICSAKLALLSLI